MRVALGEQSFKPPETKWLPFDKVLLWLKDQLNPWMYTQIHTPTVVQEGGEWWMEPLPGVFDMLQYFETILPLVESL